MCVAYCINDLLKDIGDFSISKATIEKARKIMLFIYHYNLAVNLIDILPEGFRAYYQLSHSEHSEVQECFEDCVCIKRVKVQQGFLGIDVEHIIYR